jgi:hypothetical protein
MLGPIVESLFLNKNNKDRQTQDGESASYFWIIYVDNILDGARVKNIRDYRRTIN